MTPAYPDTRPHALSVSELNRQARRLLETSFMQVWVEGEISGLSRPSSGHWYFSLKDQKCQIRCAMFRGANQHIRTLPREGDQIRIRGKVTLYENRGDFQIIVEHMEPAGLGALQQAFEALKAKLQAEGLFDPTRKQRLPVTPKHIGVVTSPTGAAIHDILTVLARRCPAIPVTIYPTAVQGKAATSEIVNAIERARQHNAADVLIIGRGGGSLEDLWCFNEETVARAIANCHIPTVSAVGHEVDVTIADFVADLRAPTPSAAAEKVSPDQQDWLRRLNEQQVRLGHSAQRLFKRLENQLGHLGARLRDPRRELQDKAQRMDELDMRLNHAMRQKIEQQSLKTHHLTLRLETQSPRKMITSTAEQVGKLNDRMQAAIQHNLRQQQDKLHLQAQTLNVVSPLATLGRGYSIVKNATGDIVRNTSQLSKGDTIRAQFGQGHISATVTEVEPP
ncbi:MAG: exodeoxyribonuclease VII large subunit [Marinobacter sp.]|uniref:exodeoxyribonuclease VII large subunit n=1 Tax=Marinobacter sp. TaxID=50741 RepID=UPI003297C386